MKRWLPPLLILAVALACAGPSDTGETGLVEETDEPYEEPLEDCEVLEIDPLGPSPPRVGDTWTVWLRCDGATLMGWTVLRFDPTDFADVDGNEATFRYAGDARMTIQVGTYRESMDVTVEP